MFLTLASKENVEEIIIASSSEVYQSTEIIPTHEKFLSSFLIPQIHGILMELVK